MILISDKGEAKMGNLIDEIKKIYLEKDYCSIRKTALSQEAILREICEMIGREGRPYSFVGGSNPPAIELFIKMPFDDCASDIKFSTHLMISRMLGYYMITHCFVQKNPVKNRIEPFLDGSSSEPYTMEQAQIEKKLMVIFGKSDYVRITNLQAQEVITEIEMPPNNFWGKQMTIETALFRDVFEVLPSLM